MFARVVKLNGDVVECGLGMGGTFNMLAYLVGTEKRPSRTLWGYDSFEGWPEPDTIDDSPRKPQKGEWKVSEETVLDHLSQSGIRTEFPDLNFKLVGGYLCDTLPQAPDRPIALLHIDVDLYQGYADALLHLFPMVEVGGIVMFDEYLEFPDHPDYIDDCQPIEKWPGCTKAVDEFFADRPETPQLYEETGKYYVVKLAQ